MEMLERLDQLGQLKPIMRIAAPKINLKIRFLENSDFYEVLGELQDDEIWSGEIRKERTQVIFHQPYLLEWLAEGLIWEPRDGQFDNWETYIEDGRVKTYSFYSVYQISALADIIESSSINCLSFFWPDDETAKSDLVKSIDEYFETTRGIDRSDFEADLCQVISSLYQPLTRTDQRSVIIPGIISSHGEGWDSLRENTDVSQIAEYFDISKDNLRNMYLRLSGKTQALDPLAKWYGLVKFIDPRKRDDLKGKALYAQTLYEMAHLLRLFYRDVYGENLPEPHEGFGFDEGRVYGEGVKDDVLEHLTYVVNRYHLNPKPNLIFVVEGEGEFKQIPLIVDRVFGGRLAEYGIEIQNLQGIGNFEGSKRNDRYGALEKFIDDHHSRQTAVFLLLDKEGRAETVAKKLLQALSHRNPIRNITSQELIHFWEKSIEFDNFSDLEIAHCMSNLSEEKYIFTVDEIKRVRSVFGERGDPLSNLYKNKLNYRLNKVKLLENLVEYVFTEGFTDEKLTSRPIIEVLEKVMDRAILNHQPTSRTISHRNQQTGLFGDVKQEGK